MVQDPLTHADVDADLDNNGNLVIVPSARAYILEIGAALLSILLLVYSARTWPASVLHFNVSIFGMDTEWSLPLFALLSLFLLARIVHALWDPLYIICDDYLLEIKGRVSFSLKSIRVHYLHVKSIEVNKPLLGRILDYGEVVLTADPEHEKAQIFMSPVAHPHQFKDVLEERVKRSLLNFGNKTASVAA